ncbi:MAG: choice-of-anchor L domain-containing protein [Verrucomicrobiota bacterium JB025]|nr:choice-of-anchor L domain-containing protein [Verrucomicrobiota bacterium JB025]
MRFALVLLFTASAPAQAPIKVDIVGTAGNHHLSWTNTSNYNYQVFMSPDLENWLDTGIAEQGNGSTITYGLMTTAEKLFYRIHETADPYNGGFLILPESNHEVDLIDGVCFAFDLNVFSTLPAKIRIYRRDYNSGDPWDQIGQITDFDEIDGIKFVRGSAIWIPDTEGEYEVMAAVVDDSGTVVASAARHVIVGSNQAPTITITSGPPVLTAEVTDPDGDLVRRVEFYDNGILIGTDTTPSVTSAGVFEFGDNIKDIEGDPYTLLKGTHNITAKAFDSRGAVGETASASQYSVTGGNARPTIEVSSPASGLTVVQGQTFTIFYTAGDPDGASDIAEVEAYDIMTSDGDIDTTAPFGALTIDTTGWQPGTHTIRVVTRDMAGAESLPLYLTAYIRTGSGATFAETIVSNIVDEATAAPTNEVFTGIEASSGLFSLGFDSGLEINSGLLLTSGSFSLWNGGDIEEDMDEDPPCFDPNYEELGDSELEDRIFGQESFDAATINFDIFCSNSQLEIIYQFGSEEYDEFVGDYNDTFMAIVDNTLVNLVPDCSDIASVYSIHPYIRTSLPAINEHLYLDDDSNIDPRVTSANQAMQVEYDGMTIRLKTHIFVTPNTIHHIKLVISDVIDDKVDSGLFIGESSVRTISPQP